MSSYILPVKGILKVCPPRATQHFAVPQADKPCSDQSKDTIFYIKPNPRHPRGSNRCLVLGNTPHCNPPALSSSGVPYHEKPSSILPPTWQAWEPVLLDTTALKAKNYKCQVTRLMLFKCTPPPCRSDSKELKGDVCESPFDKRPRTDTNTAIRPSNQACTSGMTISSFHLTSE